MRNRLLWFILGAIGITLILLIANNDAGSTFGVGTAQARISTRWHPNGRRS